MKDLKEFEKAKQEYEHITIPKELSERETAEINRAEKHKNSTNQNTHTKSKSNPFRKWPVAAAAILTVTFVAGLNVSPVFAKEMSQVPIIGELAKVLTFQQYEMKTEDYVIAVKIPTIEMISEDFADLEDSINDDIYTVCEQYAKESKADALAYREAFLETGGTLEEWQEHDITIKVWYTVQLQTEDYLSLAIHRTESWNSAAAETKLFNISLQTGEQISTEELLAATNATYYEDNFAVDTETAAIYAQQIKEIFTNKDLKKLTDLTAYPVYVGFVEEGLVIETREDFIALGTERIFTDELVASITNADVSDLFPSRAGFFVSSSDTSPSITFGVVEGQLKIKGINY